MSDPTALLAEAARLYAAACIVEGRLAEHHAARGDLNGLRHVALAAQNHEYAEWYRWRLTAGRDGRPLDHPVIHRMGENA